MIPISNTELVGTQRNMEKGTVNDGTQRNMEKGTVNDMTTFREMTATS